MNRMELMAQIDAMVASADFSFDYESMMKETECEIITTSFPRSTESFSLSGYTMAKLEEIEKPMTAEESPSGLDVKIEGDQELSKPITDGRLEAVLKGVRKASLAKTKVMFEEFIQAKPEGLKEWKVIADKYFPNTSISNTLKYIVLKFQKAGMLTWDGSYKSKAVWL